MLLGSPENLRLSWICGDKRKLSVLESLPSKGFRNPAHEIFYPKYYPTPNPGEPNLHYYASQIFRVLYFLVPYSRR